MQLSFKQNKISFFISLASLILAVIALILYASTGIIKGFTDEYSVPFFIFIIVAILGSLLNLAFRIDTVETVPFIALFIALICFFTNNANYLVAVIRAIDVSKVNSTFVLTVIFLALALLAALAALFFKGEKENSAKLEAQSAE